MDRAKLKLFWEAISPIIFWGMVLLTVWAAADLLNDCWSR